VQNLPFVTNSQQASSGGRIGYVPRGADGINDSITFGDKDYVPHSHTVKQEKLQKVEPKYNVSGFMSSHQGPGFKIMQKQEQILLQPSQ